MPKVVSSCELVLAQRPDRSKLLEWLHAELRSAMVDGRLRAGTRMPATRDFATQYAISRGSVVAVYQQLHSEGFLVSRIGSGTWVNRRLPKHARHTQGADSRPLISPSRLAGLTWVQPPRPFQYGQAVNEFPIDVWSKLAGRRMRSASSELLTG